MEAQAVFAVPFHVRIFQTEAPLTNTFFFFFFLWGCSFFSPVSALSTLSIEQYVVVNAVAIASVRSIKNKESNLKNYYVVVLDQQVVPTTDQT